jgi:nicotinate dehydrogenase subunit A
MTAGEVAETKMSVNITVNGNIHAVAADPDTPLLYILRNDLGLNGPKFGCGLAQCGACKVLLGKDAVPSCSIPLSGVGDQPITTLEGLGTIESPHPLQQAFIHEQAAQCGYCTNGLIIAAKALLDREPRPSETNIKEELAGNLCRCGTHNRVVRAIQRAAGEMHQ